MNKYYGLWNRRKGKGGLVYTCTCTSYAHHFSDSVVDAFQKMKSTRRDETKEMMGYMITCFGLNIEKYLQMVVKYNNDIYKMDIIYFAFSHPQTRFIYFRNKLHIYFHFPSHYCTRLATLFFFFWSICLTIEIRYPLIRYKKSFIIHHEPRLFRPSH